jgi:hypothetical protein
MIWLLALFAGDPNFASDVRPVLEKRCWGCHGAAVQMGGLRLDTGDGLAKGSHSGAVIVAGNSEGSLLVRLIERREPKRKMPPTGEALTSAEIASIREWIDRGAAWPKDFAAPLAIPKAAPALPAVTLRAWPRNSLDYAALASLEKSGKLPQPEASRRVLVRRVSLELTGLPPDPEFAREFLLDNRPDAYDRLVESALAFPSRLPSRHGDGDLRLRLLSAGFRQERDPAPMSNAEWRQAALSAAGSLPPAATPRDLPPAVWLSEAVRALAERALREAAEATLEAHVEALFWICLARPPASADWKALRRGTAPLTLLRAAKYVLELEEFRSKP